LNLHDRFSKNSPISNFRENRPLGAKLFHADRHRHDKAIVTFYNFANVPKNGEQPETISSHLCSCNLFSDSDRHFPASSLEVLELLSESVTQVSWH